MQREVPAVLSIGDYGTAELLGLLNAEEIAVGGAPTWLVEGLLPAGCCAILAAEPRIGKTWLAQDLAISVSSGTPFLGRKTQQRNVLYVPAEDALPDFARRMHDLRRARGLPIGDGAGSWGVQVTSQRVRIDLAAHRAALTAALLSRSCGLLVLDPLALLHSADENDAGAMLGVLAEVRQLSRATGACVLIVHHMRKPSQSDGGRRAHRVRGSNAVHGWCDVLLCLEQRREGLRLDVEARGFEAPEACVLTRVCGTSAAGPTVAHVIGGGVAGPGRPKAAADYGAQVVAALGAPRTRAELVEAVGGRKAAVLGAAKALLASGRAREQDGRLILVA